MNTFDCVIIGAGPAGLAAAQRLAGSPLRTALIDSGKPVTQRDRYEASDMTRGQGGAGLFSDGKFSFFPSASGLWTLPRSANLQAAYNWTCDLLGSYGLDTPPFPSNPSDFTVGNGEWVLKRYPSDYLPLEARLKLTAEMAETTGATTLVETTILTTEYRPDSDDFKIRVRTITGEDSELTTRRLILASGRFGPLGLPILAGERSFRRLEIGFRIEQISDNAFFKDMGQLDPKLRFRAQDGTVEWRTFCACHEGEAALTETQGLWSVSGRSDCPPTGRSNVGFNTRIMDETVAARTMPSLLSAMGKKDVYFAHSLDALVEGDQETVANFDDVYGPELREIMARGLSYLADAYPGIQNNGSRLIGPTLEGVGWYPIVNGDLRLADAPAWVAGDACGLFRGIVAAMISGHYAASSALRELTGQP